MDAGNGWRYSTWSDEDVRLHMADRERKRGGPRPSRVERTVALSLVAVALVVALIWTAVAG